MKKVLVQATLLWTMTVLGCAGNGLKFSAFGPGDVTDLNAADSVAMLKNGKDILILDVRSEKEMKSKHDFLIGATMIPERELAGRLSEIAAYKEKKVLLACPCGLRSRRAAELLVRNGFEHVYNIAAPGIPGLVDVPGAPVERR